MMLPSVQYDQEKILSQSRVGKSWVAKYVSMVVKREVRNSGILWVVCASVRVTHCVRVLTFITRDNVARAEGQNRTDDTTLFRRVLYH